MFAFSVYRSFGLSASEEVNLLLAIVTVERVVRCQPTTFISNLYEGGRRGIWKRVRCINCGLTDWGCWSNIALMPENAVPARGIDKNGSRWHPGWGRRSTTPAGVPANRGDSQSRVRIADASACVSARVSNCNVDGVHALGNHHSRRTIQG